MTQPPQPGQQPMYTPVQSPSHITVQQPDPGLAAMSLLNRISSFWSQDAVLWFHQYECVIAAQKPSDEVKYQMTVAKLGHADLQQVSDIIRNPPTTNKYETLKQRLLAAYADSDLRSFQKLLSEMDLGDQKPSQLLRKMRDLAGTRINEEGLRFMFAGHLPKHVRAILAVSDKSDLDELAAMADTIIENAGSQGHGETIARVDHQPARATTPDRDVRQLIAQLSTQMAKLTQDMASLSHGPQDRQNRSQSREPRQQGRSRSRSASKKAENNPKWLCYYHHKFKEDARKCIEPCNWKNSKN